MPALTETQLRVDKWSKCTLLGSTLLFVYSAFVLVVSMHMRHHHYQHDNSFDQQQPQTLEFRERFHQQQNGNNLNHQMMMMNNNNNNQEIHQTEDEQQSHKLIAPQQKAPEPEPFFSRQNQGHGHHGNHQRGHGFGGRFHHNNNHHEDFDATPCKLHHFGILGLVTSITGMIASFKNKRGYVLIFILLTLITEITALGFVGYQNARAVNVCTEVATVQRVKVQGQEAVLPNGMKVETISIAKAETTVDAPILEDCMKNVRHAAVLASLMIGVVACSLACCGSRFSTSLLERETEEVIENITSSCVVTEEQQEGEKAPVVAILVHQDEIHQEMKEQPQLI